MQAQPNDDIIARLSDTHEPGTEEWLGRLVSEVHRVVHLRFRRLVPDRLSRVFSIEDLAQETSIRILGRIVTCQRYSDASVRLVIVVARHVLIDQVRREGALKRFGGSPNEVMTLSNCLPSVLRNAPISCQQEMDELWATVKSVLGPRERELIKLKYAEERTNAEIGKLFGKTSHAIRALLFRVHAKLRRALVHRPEFEQFA